MPAGADAFRTPIQRIGPITTAFVACLLLGACAAGPKSESRSAPRQASPAPDPEEELLAGARGFRDVHRYLAQYPTGRYAERARAALRDSAAAHEVLQKGAGDRFVIPEDPNPSIETQIRRSLASQTWAYCIVSEEPDGQLRLDVVAGSVSTVVQIEARPGGIGRSQSKLVDKMPTLGNGSVIVFEDPVGAIQSSDPQDPLRFLILYGTGLVYLGGRGLALDEAGREVSLGRE